MQFPAHVSLSLTHNEHAAYYDRAEAYYGEPNYDLTDWVSEEQRTKAFETQSVWELHWYPNTPVGFHRVLAADLDALMAHVAERWPV